MKKMLFTTPDDPSGAAITGWTRVHWEECFFVLMKGILNSASPGCARQLIPGPHSHHGRVADELEGFTRSLFMAGPWMESSDSDILTFRGESINVVDFYRRGILAGTDPQHAEYWGQIDDHAQHLVEMAALSWGLYLSREKLWNKFSLLEKQQIGRYLDSCNQVKYHQNNWLLFNVVTNAALKKLGMPYSQKNLNKNLDACDQMHIGAGWYRDGQIDRIDYYNSWGFNFYFLIWVIIDGDSRPELADVHKERIRRFAQDFRYFVSGDGSAPYWGRSMIYRFGYVGAIALGHYLDCLDLSTGEVRTLCNSAMKFYCNNQILTDRDHLGMGWLRPSEWVVEKYSCGGSPLWAAKAFSLFLIPESSPVWSIPEEPLPIHERNFSQPIAQAGLILLGTKDSGHVQIVSQKPYHESPKYNPKYTKFAYSSIFSQDGRRIQESFNCDNALTFSCNGVTFRERWKHHHMCTTHNFSASQYEMHKLGMEDDASKSPGVLGSVITYVLIKDDFMINLHEIHPYREGLVFREGGYPLGFDTGEPEVSSAEGVEMASLNKKITYIRRLWGYTDQFAAASFQEDLSGSNVRYLRSIVPKLGATSTSTAPLYLSCMVYGKIGTESLEDLSRQVVSFEMNDNQAQVEFYDGERVFLQIGKIKAVSPVINGKSFRGRVVMARVSADGMNYEVLMENDLNRPSSPLVERFLRRKLNVKRRFSSNTVTTRLPK